MILNEDNTPATFTAMAYYFLVKQAIAQITGTGR
jgi:hypothetical protein